MDANREHYLYVFESRNHAILVFSLLEESGYKNFQLLSTPCGIKAGCGYSIKFYHHNYLDIVDKRARSLGIVDSRLFYVDYTSGRAIYREILF